MRREDSLRGKFQHIPRNSGPVVYVAELSNGIVKVGITERARQRVGTLQYEARRIFGDVQLCKFHICQRYSTRVDALRAEDAAMVGLFRVAQPASERNGEFFTGITFEDALLIVARATA